MLSDSEIERREKQVKALIDQYKLGSQLYHYTSVHALYGILKSHELWLGNTGTMNDGSEITNFIRKLQKALINVLPLDRHEECNTYFDGVYKRIKSEYPFAFCLSRLRDNAAQWERYADGAKGVCIVFNTENLLKLLFYCGGIFAPIFYNDNIEDHDHYKILRKYFTGGELPEFDNEKGQIDTMVVCGYVHKHESFDTEQEIRASTLWTDTLKYSSEDYIVINGQIKRVLKFNFEEACKGESVDFQELIDKIIIGPRSEQNKYELEKFVEKCGFSNLKIEKSDCPLR